jgi:hypothetical protein
MECASAWGNMVYNPTYNSTHSCGDRILWRQANEARRERFEPPALKPEVG